MNRSWIRTAIVALAQIAVGSATLMPQPLKQGKKNDFEVTPADRVPLKATYYDPGKPGPGVLLLHQCNSDRKSWDPLATELTNVGFHVVTVDYRGYGESGGDRISDPAQRRTVMTERWPLDVEAVYAAMVGFGSSRGLDKSRMAVGGASCGVTQASILATKRNDIKALVLLSGQASEEGKAYLAKTNDVAVFGAAAEGDVNAAKGIDAAVSASKNPHKVLKIIKGSAHGVPMFNEAPDLLPAIVDWLKARLASH